MEMVRTFAEHENQFAKHQHLITRFAVYSLEFSQYKWHQTTILKEFHYLEEYCFNLSQITIETICEFSREFRIP